MHHHNEKRSKVMVTGAAGFIGSHLVDALLKEGDVVIGVDNMSAGLDGHLEQARAFDSFTFIKADLLMDDISSSMQGVHTVYHLAANPDIRSGAHDTRSQFDQNIVATYNLLEACRKGGVRKVVFSSTSAVYGETESIPTHESLGPLLPISMYGAAKASCEAMISAYCHQFEMAGVIFRFANVVGTRSTHNVLHDFIRKLREDPQELEILGAEPGTCKSYVHVLDCVRAMLVASKACEGGVEIYNIGTDDWTYVSDIADSVVRELGLSNVHYRWTGGVKGGGGWIGDVRRMLLSTDRIRACGWSPELNSAEAIRTAVREILEQKR